jgi:hypothetical protein
MKWIASAGNDEKRSCPITEANMKFRLSQREKYILWFGFVLGMLITGIVSFISH